MKSKMLALQKVILWMIFCKGPEKVTEGSEIRQEFIVLWVAILAGYGVQMSFFSGIFPAAVIFSAGILPQIYRIIVREKAFLFELPIKRSLMVANIFVFSFLVAPLAFLLLWWLMNAVQIVSALSHFFFTGSTAGFPFNKRLFEMCEEMLVETFVVVIYNNALLVTMFLQKKKSRILATISICAAFCGLSAAAWGLAPVALHGQSASSYVHRLMVSPSGWWVIAATFTAAVAVTLLCIPVALRVSRPGHKSLAG